MQVLIFPHQILRDVLENSVSISLANDICPEAKSNDIIR